MIRSYLIAAITFLIYWIRSKIEVEEVPCCRIPVEMCGDGGSSYPEGRKSKRLKDEVEAGTT